MFVRPDPAHCTNFVKQVYRVLDIPSYMKQIYDLQTGIKGQEKPKFHGKPASQSSGKLPRQMESAFTLQPAETGKAACPGFSSPRKRVMLFLGRLEQSLGFSGQFPSLS